MIAPGFSNDDGRVNLLQKPHRTMMRRKCRRMAVILFRLAGSLPVFFACGIIAALFSVAVTILIPAIYESLFFRLPLYALGSCLAFWVCRSLYYVLTAPFISADDYFERLAGCENVQTYFCAKCNKRAPMNAHHCAVCDMCIMEHDHHCVFMNRCIGAGNLDHFYSFLHSCIVSTGVMLLLCVPVVFDHTRVFSKFGRLEQFFATTSILLAFVVLSLVIVMRVVMWNDAQEALSH